MATAWGRRRRPHPGADAPRNEQQPLLSSPTPALLALALGACLGLYLGLLRAYVPEQQQLLAQVAAVSLPPAALAAAVPPALPLPLPPPPAPSCAPPPLPPPAAAAPPAPAPAAQLDAAAYLAALAVPPSLPRWGLAAADAAASSSAYDPWPGASRAAGWREFSRPQLLACLAARGGVGFVGDSVMRMTVNALLEMLGSGDAVNEYVPHVQQAYSRDFAAEAAEAAAEAAAGPVPAARFNTSCTVAFRFATSLAPGAGARAGELLRSGTVRALVAGSGFWDLTPSQGGAGDASALSSYAWRMANFLQAVRGALGERARADAEAAAGGAAGGALPPPPPPALVWRSITPTVHSRAPEDRRDPLSLGRTTAANAVAARLLEHGWNAAAARGAGLPRVGIVDAHLLLPPGDEARVSADGYHPAPAVLQQLVWAVFSELCPAPGLGVAGLQALEALAQQPAP